MIYTIWQLMLSTWDIKVNLPFPGPLSLSISSTFCRQRRAVRALTVLISGIRLAPTGQMWNASDWALRSRILSQQVAGKPQSSSIAVSHAEETHRPVCVNSTSSKVITKGDAISQPTEVLEVLKSSHFSPGCRLKHPKTHKSSVKSHDCWLLLECILDKMENFANRFDNWDRMVTHRAGCAPGKLHGRPTILQIPKSTAGQSWQKYQWFGFQFHPVYGYTFTTYWGSYV